MAKDKEIKLADDKAITFQRAVFIVCNLRRLIKRPKNKDDQSEALLSQSSSLQPDGRSTTTMGYASGANSASASGQQYRGSSRRRQRDPVRRALTLPNLIAGPHNDCYSLACLLMSNECDQSRIAAWHECRRRDSGSNRTNMIDPSGAQVQWQPQQNSPSHIRHSGQLSSVPIAIFTPTSGFRSTAGHQSADARRVDQSDDSFNNQLLNPRYSADNARNPKQSFVSRVHSNQWQALSTGQIGSADKLEPALMCPIWARVMSELDRRQAKAINFEPSYYAHLIGSPVKQPILLQPKEPHLAYSSDSDEKQRHSARREPRRRRRARQANERDELELEPEAQPESSEAEPFVLEAEADFQDQNIHDELERYSAQNLLKRRQKSGSKQLQQQTLLQITSDSRSHKLDSSGASESSQKPGKSLKRFRSALNLFESANQKQEVTPPLIQMASPMRRRQTSKQQHQSNKTDSSGQKLGHNTASNKATKNGAAKAQNKQSRLEVSTESRVADKRPKASGNLLELPDGSGDSLTLRMARQRRPSASNQTTTNVDQQALFSAVERNQLERARSILAGRVANVNCLSGDKLACLDIAVLMRYIRMVRLLQAHGAKEGSAYLDRDGRANQLYTLYSEALKLVQDLSRSLGSPSAGQQMLSSSSGTQRGAQPADNQELQELTHSGSFQAPASQLSNALVEEKYRQLQYWKRRLDLFMRMRYEFERLKPPGKPELVVLQATGDNSLSVKIVHSVDNREFKSSRFGLESAKSMDKRFSCASQGPQHDTPLALAFTDRACGGLDCSHPRGFWGGFCGSAAPQKRDEIVCDDLTASTIKIQNKTNEPDTNDKARKLSAFNYLLSEQMRLLSGCQLAQRRPRENEQLDSRRPTVNHSGFEWTWRRAQSSGQVRRPSQWKCQAHGADSISKHSVAYQLLSGRGARFEQDLAPNETAEAEQFEASCLGESLCAFDSSFECALDEDPIGDEDSLANWNCGPIITKYKVEWSPDDKFENPNSMIVYKSNSCPLECRIDGLANGREYFVRVAAGNHKGYSGWRYTIPLSLAPSSWRQVDGIKRRRYDELVFRKFTKLILLNRHILDDHSSLEFASQQQQQTKLGPSSAQNAQFQGCSSQHTQQQRQQQHQHQHQQQPQQPSSKSNLISMLLLDASDSASLSLKLEDGSGSNRSGNNMADERASTAKDQTSQSSVRKNLKNFFQSNSFKFHKLNNQNKRGLYLCTIIYFNDTTTGANLVAADNKLQTPVDVLVSSAGCEAKIVVTNDDRLPVIEVMNELVSPAALLSDFYWLLKISGTQWLDIRRLRQQLQKSHSSSSLHLRIKLLGAIEQMQTALNIDDIGRLFYKPIQSHDGSIVVCTCKQVASCKLVSSLSIKWTSQQKIIPRHLRKISDSMLIEQRCQSGNSTTNFASSTTSAACQSQFHAPSIFSSHDSHAGGPIGTSRDSLLSVDWRHCGQQQQQQPLQQQAPLDSGSVAGLRQCDLCNQSQRQQHHRRSPTNLSSSSSLISSNYSANITFQANNANITTTTTTTNNLNNPSPNSSQSSLASSLDGQSVGAAGGSDTFRCVSCGHHVSSSCNAPMSPFAMNSDNGAAQNNPRHSTSSAIYPAPSSSNRSASMYLGIGGSSNPHGSRHSQPIGCAPQRASPYLMLASLTIYDLLLFSLSEIIYFERHSKNPLKRGLYLGFLQMSATVESMRLLVPRYRPNMLPCVRIRDNSHVSREEWLHLRKSPNCAASSVHLANWAQDRASSLQVRNNRSLSKFMHQSDLNRAKSVSPRGLGAPTGASHLLSVSSDHLATMVDGSTKKATIRDQSQTSRSGSASSASTGPLMVPQDHQRLSVGDSTSDSQLQASTDAHTRPHYRTASFGQERGEALRRDANRKLKSRGSDEQIDLNSCQQTNGPKRFSHSPEETFVRLVGSAARRLLNDLKTSLPKVYDQQQDEMVSIFQSLNDPDQNRIYHLELIELSNQVNFILLIPSVENVCPVTSHEDSNILSNNQDYMLLPMQFFETLHIGTYEPDLLGKYCRLSAILETDLIVAQHDHRQAFSSNELKSTKSRLSNLQEMVSITDDFWRRMRWIADVVAFARDKSLSSSMSGIRVGSIWNIFESIGIVQTREQKTEAEVKLSTNLDDNITKLCDSQKLTEPSSDTRIDGESNVSPDVKLIVSDPKRKINLTFCRSRSMSDGEQTEGNSEDHQTNTTEGLAYHISMFNPQFTSDTMKLNPFENNSERNIENVVDQQTGDSNAFDETETRERIKSRLGRMRRDNNPFLTDSFEI